MVVALGPGRFYGSSLPRPRFYNDVKFSESRVDPPPAVMDPLLSWANEAHWSMGGLSFTRHRLQGRIEGSVKKLRAQQEKIQGRTPSPPAAAAPMSAVLKPTRSAGQKPSDLSPLDSSSSDSYQEAEAGNESEVAIAPSPKGSGTGSAERKRKRVRRLGEEFDRIAAEHLGVRGEVARGVASRTRSRRSLAEENEVAAEAEDGVADAARKKGSPAGKKQKVYDGMPRRTSPRKKQ